MSEPRMNDASAVNPDQPGAPQPALVAPGAQLAAYRRERGWTVEQVASQLNLAPRQIVAIESDDYPSLPGMPIVRGFIRSYAKLLKVDAAPLLTTLGGETVLAHESIAPRKTLTTPFAETRLPSMMDRPSLSSKWIIGLLLAVLLGVAIWAAQQNSDIAGLQQSAETQVKDGLAYLSGAESNSQKPNAAQPAEATPVTPSPAMTSNQSVDTGVMSAPPATSPVAPPAVTQPPAPEPSAATPAATSANEAVVPVVKDALVLKAREESWVEVKRAENNRNLFAKLMKAGETETVEITEPVSLVIGNASGVDASLRGAPLELKAGKSNVARINLK